MRLTIIVLFILGLAGTVSTQPAPALSWSGFSWTIKTSRGAVGPGPCRFDAGNVSVDPAGRLHLFIRQNAGGWTCAEIISDRVFGHGEYRFAVAETRHLPASAVLGLFLWDQTAPDDHFREVDLEVSRWGVPTEPNAQFVLMPFTRPGNRQRFRLPGGPADLSFRWSPGRLDFAAAANNRRVRTQTMTIGVFGEGRQQVHLNLWLFNRVPPADGKPVEVIVNAFRFTSLKR